MKMIMDRISALEQFAVFLMAKFPPGRVFGVVRVVAVEPDAVNVADTKLSSL